ncbi:MAG: DUF58 domain-containing protein [Victivallaceae bacterium]
MLSSELIAQVRKIEIRTRRAVDEIIGGAYHSVFKGRGIEFDEVREYSDEDDFRDIDWNVTARMGAPYIKKYVEERELNVMLLVDVSASGAFGSGEKSKRRYAIETAALLAFSAIRNNDRVGLTMFSDRTELYLSPRSGRKHGLRLVRDLMAFEPERRKTNIDLVLQETIKVLNKKTVIFLISDLIDEHDFQKSLRIINRRHDVIAVRILDPLELKWPAGVNVTLEDAESGNNLSFNARNRKLVENFSRAAENWHDKSKTICEKARVDMIEMRCGEDIVKPLINFFNKRRKRH